MSNGSSKTHQANVLEPLTLEGGPFRSIALMCLLHCLPGMLRSKGVITSVDTSPPRGMLFGATVLGPGRVALEAALTSRFERHEVRIQGSVALFEARGYRSGVT